MSPGPPDLTTHTIRSILAESCERIRQSGSDSPGLDAELIVGHAFGLSRVQLRTQDQKCLTNEQIQEADRLIARRVAREPVAYILGTAAFRRIELNVDSRVLIPRPETELLVEWALEHAKQPRSRPVRIVDCCTGSGAIAIALADELESGSAEICATDLSSDALSLARENAARLGASVEFLEGDLLAPVTGRRFDIVLANPPYVDPSDRDSLQPDVVDYEPAMALFVEGGDAFAPTRSIIAQAFELLETGGLCAVEVGEGHAGSVVAMLRDSGFVNVEIRNDLQGIGRAIGGIR